jgi:hypothetical protein
MITPKTDYLGQRLYLLALARQMDLGRLGYMPQIRIRRDG